jgi:AcrR family transcriptional regulator
MKDTKPTNEPDSATGPRPPQQARSARSLQKFLDAGLRLLSEHEDFERISVNELVAAAGGSSGAFYGRFQNKSAFFIHLEQVAVDALLEKLDHQMTTPVWQHGPATAILQDLMHSHVGTYRANRGLFKAALKSRWSEDNAWAPVLNAGKQAGQKITPVLLTHLPPRADTNWSLELGIGFQAVNSLLMNILLNDPGPLRLDDPTLADRLHRLICAHLGLPLA